MVDHIDFRYRKAYLVLDPEGEQVWASQERHLAQADADLRNKSKRGHTVVERPPDTGYPSQDRITLGEKHVLIWEGPGWYAPHQVSWDGSSWTESQIVLSSAEQLEEEIQDSRVGDIARQAGLGTPRLYRERPEGVR